MIKKIVAGLAILGAVAGFTTTQAQASGCQASSGSWTEVTLNCGVYNMRAYGTNATADTDAGLKVRMDGNYNGASVKGIRSNGTIIAECFASDKTFDSKYAVAISDTCNSGVKYQYTAVQ